MTLFDDFWLFLPCAKNVEMIFDTFWRFLTWPLSAGPFCGPLTFRFGIQNFSGAISFCRGATLRSMGVSVKVKRGRQKGDGKENLRKCHDKPVPFPSNPITDSQKANSKKIMPQCPQRIPVHLLKNGVLSSRTWGGGKCHKNQNKLGNFCKIRPQAICLC